MATKIISELQVETVRKNIKNIHLGVYPPNGRIRIAVPLKTSDELIKLFIITKLYWIKKQQKQFLKQERQTPREYVTGETHYFFGKSYRLNVIYTNELIKIEIRKKKFIDLYIRPNTTVKQREELFENFYRSELYNILPKLIKKWEKKVGVKIKEVKIKKMKTKWGTCNSKDKRIWLNLELVKKPFNCIDYVLVHELIHLIEKNHSEKFFQIINSIMPHWQSYKNELNQSILGYTTWN